MTRLPFLINNRPYQQSIAFVIVMILGFLSIIASNGNGDDNAGKLQFSSATYGGTEGTNLTVTIIVSRTGGDDGDVSVDYATANGTAIAPADYNATSGTLSWGDGDSASKSFVVTLVNDTAVELSEVFEVSLSNVKTASLGLANAIVTITDNDSIPVTGTVYAPSGTLALKEPGILEKMFSVFFGAEANAAISNLVAAVPGVTVGIYELDTSGNLVSATPFTSATTNSYGAFELSAPLDAPAVKYIIRASGATQTMDSRLIASTVDIDPTTHATSRLVTAVTSNYSDIDIDEVIAMQEDIASLVTDIDPSGANATQLSDRLFNKAQSGVGQYNVLRSKTSSGQICGNVKAVSTIPLQEILIVVDDYSDWTRRAKGYTDVNGDYCINVPRQGDVNPDGGSFSGEYIVGAINRTDDSIDPERSASEWLGNGTTYTRFEASKISVPDSTPVTGVNFILEAGVRVRGTVRAVSTLAALEGVQVVIRDFDTERRLASARVEEDGTYQVNVIPGTYHVTARNMTQAPYASEVYDGSSGSNNPNLGALVTAVAGDELIIDFELESGGLLEGNVSDGSPIINTQIKIDIEGDANAENVTTDRNGDYDIWLKPGTYDVYAYGQRSHPVNLSASATVNFTAAVSTVTGQMIDSLSNPVRNAGVWLYHSPDPMTANLTGVSSGDSYGRFSVHTMLTGNHFMLSRLARQSSVGSQVYFNHTRLLSGDAITIAAMGSTHNLGNVTLPEGGVLTGKVFADSSGTQTTPMANFRVQVRNGGVSVDDHFIQVRTRSDGSYRVALPTATYSRIKMRDASGADTGNGNCDNVPITASTTTVLNFYNGNNICEVNP